MKKQMIRALTVTAIFSAAAALLQFLEIPVPLMPGFVKLDFSDVPELIVAFAEGPLWGAAVCLLKNLVHLPVTSSFGVGELCNFLLGLCFVLPAGRIYRRKHDRAGALLACLVGTATMAAASFPINLWISYPIYCALFGGEENIVAAYRAILPSVGSLPVCLAVFNLPFTFVKGAVDSAVVFLIYKPLSTVIKGRR